MTKEFSEDGDRAVRRQTQKLAACHRLMQSKRESIYVGSERVQQKRVDPGSLRAGCIKMLESDGGKTTDSDMRTVLSLVRRRTGYIP